MLEKLKPCPHCSCTEIYVHESKVKAYAVCPACGMHGPISVRGSYKDFKAKAIHAWNTLLRNTGEVAMLQWTEEKPVQKGFYFYKAPNSRVFVVEVKSLSMVVCENLTTSTDCLDGEWAGPIPVPKG